MDVFSNATKEFAHNITQVSPIPSAPMVGQSLSAPAVTTTSPNGTVIAQPKGIADAAQPGGMADTASRLGSLSGER